MTVLGDAILAAQELPYSFAKAARMVLPHSESDGLSNDQV